MADEEFSPEEPTGDDFQEMLRKMLGGAQGFDPAQLAGMGIDPAMMQNVMHHLQGAFAGGSGSQGIPWESAKTQALHLANRDGLSISSGSKQEFDQAFALATLWLSESTTVPELSTAPRAITRGDWVEATLPVWQQIAEPVATSIAGALTAVIEDNVPEEMKGMIAGAGRILHNLGSSMFAAQMGAAVGKLALEVVSGGDVGLPVMPDGEAAILPQNFEDFGRDLEIEQEQLALYLSTRELAHARLFRHAKWLRLHVISQVTEYARGIHVDASALEDLASRFDPSHPEELKSAIESGALLPQRSPAQDAALTRLENLLATIEGWVEVVTADATSRLPSADKIGEAVRRRRAVGGPAEAAMASLVGLELRPRRLREASAMWRAVTGAVGVAARDGLWDYPDLMPTAEDIDDPAALIARLEAQQRGEQPARDAMDDALEALLNEGDTGSGSGSGDDTSEPEDPRPL